MEHCGPTLVALFIEFTMALLMDPADLIICQVWFDVTAEHRITGIYFDQEWTAVQFCPAPRRYPDVKVWTNVRHRND